MTPNSTPNNELATGKDAESMIAQIIAIVSAVLRFLIFIKPNIF